MAKEVLTLNDFSGGLNTYSLDRDIKTPGKDPSAVNNILSSFLQLGEGDKGGQFTQLWNAEVDIDGVLRVSGGISSTLVGAYGQGRYPDGLIQGGGLFSYPSDYSLNLLEEGILNDGLTNHWDLQTATQVSTDTITLSDKSTTTTLNPSSSFSNSFIKLSGTVDQYGNDATNLGYIELRLGDENGTGENVKLHPGRTYTLRFKMASNQPYVETAGAYPPSVKIYNTEQIYDSSGDGDADASLYNTVDSWGTAVTTHGVYDGTSMVVDSAAPSFFSDSATSIVEVVDSSSTPDLDEIDVGATGVSVSIVQGEGMPTYWGKHRTFQPAYEGTTGTAGSGAALLVNGSGLASDAAATTFTIDDGTNAPATATLPWIANSTTSPGDVLKIEDEEMLFISIHASNGTVTVGRGHNGTTAATHADNKAVNKLANRINALKIVHTDVSPAVSAYFGTDGGTDDYIEANIINGEIYQCMFYYRTESTGYNPVFTIDDEASTAVDLITPITLPNTTIGDTETTANKIALADYNNTVSGAVKGTLTSHGLRSGDIIYLTETPTFRGNQKVYVIDKDNFYFEHPAYALAGLQATISRQLDGSTANDLAEALALGEGEPGGGEDDDFEIDETRRFQVGDVIRVGSEDMKITAISGNTTISVTRDYNGTSETTHSSGADILLQDKYAVGHVWRPATFSLDNPNNSRGWITFKTTSSGKIRPGFSISAGGTARNTYVSHFDIFKASGMDIETLAYNNDEFISPYKDDFIGTWNEYQYTFTMPEGVKTSKSWEDAIDGWKIKFDAGHVVDPAFNNTTSGGISTHNLYIDDIRLTSDEFDFMYLFTRNTNTSSNLLAYSPGNSSAENIVQYNGLDADFKTYIANGRVFISDANYSNKDNRPFQLQHIVSDRNTESIGKGSTSYWKKGVHTNEGPQLVDVTSVSGGIDYDNVVKFIDNGLINATSFDRRTYARRKQYDSAGDSSYVSWAVITDDTGVSGEGSLSFTNEPDHRNIFECENLYSQNMDNRLLFWNEHSNNYTWGYDFGTALSVIHRLFTLKGNDTSNDNLDLDGKLENDVALIEWEIKDEFSGYELEERMLDATYGAIGNLPVNWTCYIYNFGDVTMDTSSTVNSYPSGQPYTSPGTNLAVGNAWNGAVLGTENRFNIQGESIYSWQSNPDRLPYSQLYTMHNDASAINNQTTTSRTSDSDYITAHYFGSASFPHGRITQTNLLGFRLSCDIRNMMESDRMTPSGSTRGAAGTVQYGTALVTLEKLHIYGYTSGFAATSMPDSFSGGAIVNLNFTGTEGSGWDRTWDVAITSVNVHGEESAFSNIHQGESGGTSTQQLEMSVYISKGIVANKYLDKLKVYMKSSDLDIFYLQAEIDLGNKTIKSSTSGRTFPGLFREDKGYFSFMFAKAYGLQPNFVDSYESQTTVSQDIAFDSQNMYCRFKTATICNNRVYVGNIEQNGRVYSDRMIKSPLNQFGILPSSSFIDVAINDGDEIIHLESFKDTLIQFKKNKVFIISVSEGLEYLENTLDNLGVSYSSQVCKTPKGIAWITNAGCFVWDGKELTNLTQDKLAIESFTNAKCKWEINVDDIPQIGYLKEADKLVIFKSTKPYVQGNNTDTQQTGFVRYLDGYIYDFNNSAWTMIFNRTHAKGEKSNFIHDLEGNLVWNNSSLNGSGNAKFLKWQNGPVKMYDYSLNTDLIADKFNDLKQFRIVTKDFAFEEPGIRKKIYKVYVTFKSSSDVGTSDEAAANSNVLLYYAINGQGDNDSTTNWTEFPQSTEAGGSTVLYKASSEDAGSAGFQGTTTFKTVEIKPSSSINNIYSFQLKFEWDKQTAASDSLSVPDGFMINDISIVYRKKGIK